MKNTDKKWQVQRKLNSFASVKLIIAIAAIIGLGLSACDNDNTPAHTHTWGSDVVTAPTCTTAGYTTQTCSDCQETQQINLTAALGHDGNWTTYTSGIRNCQRSDCSGTVGVGDTGPADGIIFYVAASGFTVQGYTGGAGAFTKYTAYYLEAAPENQGTSLIWASSSSPANGNVKGVAGTAIGTGKANTAAILVLDANAPAAKACKDYDGGGKNDWFLPSKDELNEMYEARTHLGISSGDFWSSSQYNYNRAWGHYFDLGGFQDHFSMDGNGYVRAIRAF